MEGLQIIKTGFNKINRKIKAVRKKGGLQD
jgi:hypothetical protein